MKTSLISAKYNSDEKGLGFKRGANYVLKVTQSLFGRVKVVNVHGYELQEYSDKRKNYRNLGEFLNSWTDVDVLQIDVYGVPQQKAPQQEPQLIENAKKAPLKV